LFPNIKPDNRQPGTFTSNFIRKFTFSAWVKADTWGEGNQYGNIFDKGFTTGKAFYLHKTAGTGGLAFVHGFKDSIIFQSSICI